jgi:hypothetical protein
VKRTRQNGSLLVAALLLFSLMLTLGLGLMSSQSARMRAARAQTQAIKARALALAGWEDVRAKLGKDILFLQNAETQDVFSYSEDVYDTDGEYVGNYLVQIDLRWEAIAPESLNPTVESVISNHYTILPVTCIGKVSESRVGEILAERELYFELDVRNWQIIRSEDRGSL